MGSIVNFSNGVRSAISAGQTVADGSVVKLIADSGAEIGEATVTTVMGGNGMASNVYSLTSRTAGGSATTTGVSILTLDVGLVGAALAPALGVTAGYGLYKTNPAYWTNLMRAFTDDNKTIGQKIIAFWNGDNLLLDDGVIEMFKQSLVDMGFFDFEIPEYLDTGEVNVGSYLGGPEILNWLMSQGSTFHFQNNAFNNLLTALNNYPDYIAFGRVIETTLAYQGWSPLTMFLIPVTQVLTLGASVQAVTITTKALAKNAGSTEFVIEEIATSISEFAPYVGSRQVDAGNITYKYISGVNTMSPSYLQDGARLPSDENFTDTYPSWIPWEYPDGTVETPELPTIYPIKYPGIEPNPYPKQDEAQDPDSEDDDEVYPVLLPDFPIPKPYTGGQEDEDEEEDPDVEIEDPDPIPVNPDPIPEDDPVDPNGDDPVTPVIPDPNLPDTVTSTALFTVYNPSSSNLNALGTYLWDSSLMASIRDIWQDPLDGIISLIQVYATPSTSGSHNIILGYLDSGVGAPVVSSQFVTVDCGSVTVSELKENATDYAPYTSLHLFLPFIGTVELDASECMNATIKVIYHIDVYTGTCLAEVKVKRNKDMPNSPILYTYSGNCSQQIPLTSGNATGVLSALIGGITAGLSVASGGGLGVVAGASIAGQSLTHDMFHVNHSGNISANAGIMGHKKPYLIIGRRHQYDANNYDAFYGFPANKTINLGNQTGYVKVKKCFLKTSATKPEHDEIMRLLQEGVIL